jgi:hypothetical protein
MLDNVVINTLLLVPGGGNIPEKLSHQNDIGACN